MNLKNDRFLQKIADDQMIFKSCLLAGLLQNMYNINSITLKVLF